MGASDTRNRGRHRRQRSRRWILQAASVVTASLVLPVRRALAQETAEQVATPQFEAAYAKLTGGSEPASGPIKLELPEVAENGNMVPFTVSVESPMTPDNYVKTLTILSTGNPQPVIARFHLSPASGRALVSGRLRLARTQDVIAVAELSNGTLIKAITKAAVTVGGCGG